MFGPSHRVFAISVACNEIIVSGLVSQYFRALQDILTEL
ncbi:protein of unknown function [Pseudomonas inefficax]|uniref:Uncharacterized protein n=1 Tax=Pseudomonas inefficax TaxID=2078786 RepID=A0AAQ1P3Q0_9PSED|nr:protein of unknown function [Pseudomonas inefficax]